MKKENLKKSNISQSKKVEALVALTPVADGTNLTTNQGLAINDDTNSLKGGERGPSLMATCGSRSRR